VAKSADRPQDSADGSGRHTLRQLLAQPDPKIRKRALQWVQERATNGKRLRRPRKPPQREEASAYRLRDELAAAISVVRQDAKRKPFTESGRAAAVRHRVVRKHLPDCSPVDEDRAVTLARDEKQCPKELAAKIVHQIKHPEIPYRRLLRGR